MHCGNIWNNMNDLGKKDDFTMAARGYILNPKEAGDFRLIIQPSGRRKEKAPCQG